MRLLQDLSCHILSTVFKHLMDLDLSLKNAPLTTMRMYAKRLEKLGIKTIRDLLFHFPHRYEDFTLVTPIALSQNGETVTVRGGIIDTQNSYTRRGFKIQKVRIKDASGEIDCLWFNQPFVLSTIKLGDMLSVSGRVDQKGAHRTLMVKNYEVITEMNGKTRHTGVFVPIYPETRGVSSKWLRNRTADLLEKTTFEEYLPEETIRSVQLMPLDQAIRQIHFPQSLDEATRARKRLAFDELLFIQLSAMTKRHEWKQITKTQPIQVAKYKMDIEKLIKSLPFLLTGAQIRAFEAISKDLEKSTPMNRMLEGDVGSGKTVVAALSIYAAFLNSFQAVLMAPTEILAKQHFSTISRLLNDFGVNVGLLTSSHKEGRKAEFDVLIGTHALINEKIKFKNLNLVIIDEQQRFGVKQRAILRDKGISPHFLTMTATPIPRTVFLTLYGDLDISYLDEMPKERKKIKTWLVPKVKRDAAYDWIKKQILTVSPGGRRGQVFIICPFIEESENATTVKAALKEYEYLKKEVFPEFKMGLLHGKMKSGEKHEILEKFHKGKYDILVATPVVEVGIDIPNATVMVIEASERFGLSQLHQLRGRVGRGNRESFCLLFTESDSTSTLSRLKSLESIQNGAELAEIDLKMRGAGDIYGTAQHGVPKLKIASFSDRELLELTREQTKRIFKSISRFPKLQEKVKSTIIQEVSPD